MVEYGRSATESTLWVQQCWPVSNRAVSKDQLVQDGQRIITQLIAWAPIGGTESRVELSLAVMGDD